MTGQRARDLEAAYNHYLKKQIVDQGSSLPCRDETLCNEVEELLKNEDGRDTHCLGLDTFNIMEESLRFAGTDRNRAPKVRTGLRDLARAFEVLEQAALNLYLGPWREEYKVVKMYSGIFTHCIKPVFSTQQTELLFGLLGYKKCSTQREQLRLHPQKGSTTSMDDLLRLSCAFFVARCECRLLLTALGKCAGQPQWELSVVRERQRGHSLQIALDNTKRLGDVKQPLQELSEESDMDLYTDEQDGEELKETAVDDAPQSLPWMPEKSANDLSTTSVYVSTYHRQLKKPEADSTDNDFSSISRYNSNSYAESSGDKKEALPVSLEEKTDNEILVNQTCTCLEVKYLYLYMCTECQTFHHFTCPKFDPCKKNHTVEYIDKIPEQFIPMQLEPSKRRGSRSPTLTSSSAAFSSLTLNDDQKSNSFHKPIAYHHCCDVSSPDPRVLCFTCRQFHSSNCESMRSCLGRHDTKNLGLCSEGSCTERNIARLCRYCGNEFCKKCWFTHPIKCTCGQTFDQSSPV